MTWKQGLRHCTPMFTAAWFTTAKRWRWPWCPQTDEKNVVSTQWSKQGVLEPATWTPKPLCSVKCAPQRMTNIMWSHLCEVLESPTEVKSHEQFQKKETASGKKDVCTQLGQVVTAVVGLCTGLSCGDPNTSLNLESGGGFLEAYPRLG